MSETPYGLETRVQEVEMRGRTAAPTAGHRHPGPPNSPSRHRLAERLRRVADRLEA
jgi:hypothetical protein